MQEKEIKKDDYTVKVGYSEEAAEKKLLKFITKSGDEFEVSAEELASMIAGGVNSEMLSASFVETDRINVVEVGRQLECVLEEDKKKGDKILINYKHPYPLDFAIIEEAYKIAKIDMEVPSIVLTEEYIESIREKLTPQQDKFITRFYKGFKNLVLKKKE